MCRTLLWLATLFTLIAVLKQLFCFEFTCGWLMWFGIYGSGFCVMVQELTKQRRQPA